MDKRKQNKGTLGNNGGRKPKAEEQKLIEKLSPLEPLAFDALTKAIEEGKDWAVKLFFNYQYGMPKQIVDQNNNVTVSNFDITKIYDADKKA
jgi:hypothetical protein